MTEFERDSLRRRELLAKLASFAMAAPALQVLNACATDPATPGTPPGVGGVGNTGTSTAPVGTGGAAGTSSAPSSVAGRGTPQQTPPTAGTTASTGTSTPPSGGTAGAGAAGSAPIDTAGTGAGPVAGGGASGGTSLDSLACVVSPALTEGPFFVDMQMERSNLIEDDEPNVKNGVPLEITFGVFKVNGMTCEPLSGATVDIWHADTQGVYSNIGRDNPNSFIQPQDTGTKKFLRGWQKTGEAGIAKFTTVYPGFYGSRCIHIHFKIRGVMGLKTMDFTSQIFFDDDLNAEILKSTPAYKQGKPVTNRTDMVFTTGDGGFAPTAMVPTSKKVPGDQLLVALTKKADGKGYEGAFKIGLML